jgi:CO/xanthine dehydrogenase Mo-binding subunit
VAEFTSVGRPIPKLDAVDKVTGRHRYSSDVVLPGLLWGKVLRSPYPHARIRALDTSAAETLPGVAAVLTWRDLPAKRLGFIIKDHDVLASDVVRYCGEPVAAVAAESEAAAEAACQAIRVDYEELPAVFEPEAAMAPGAPLVHEHLASYEIRAASTAATMPPARPLLRGNVCHHFKLRHGDVEAAFRAARHVFEDEFGFQMVHHAPLEPHSSVAQVMPSGEIVVWSGVQAVHRARQWLAEYFDLPQSKVRVISLKVGGGFGGKITLSLEPIVIALARKAGRPVKIVMTRAETFIATGGRRPGRMTVRTGVDQSGQIVARQVRVLWNSGTLSESGPISVTLAGLLSPGPYRIPNVRVDSYLVYTNTVAPRAFRGLGAPQVLWATESHMDILARKLGLDPLEFRLRHVFEDGDIAPWGEKLHSVTLKECLQRAAAEIGWYEAKGGAEGRGLACIWKWTVPGTLSQALVKVYEDGTVGVMTGVADLGTGSSTIMAQIAAEELDVDVDSVNVVVGDTELTPYDYGSASSRSTVHGGNAVREAAIAARRQIVSRAAAELGVPAERIELKKGKIWLAERPDEGIPLARFTKGHVLGFGSFQGGGTGQFDPETGATTRATHDWKWGATGVMAGVDQDTGVVRIKRLVSVNDVGFAINPLNVETQIQGSVVMGLGATLLEEVSFDGGRIANPNFMEYLLPTATDLPDEIVPVVIESRKGDGPYGAKGIGEPPIVGVSPAVANAIDDAVGVRIRELPITSERVARALHRLGEEADRHDDE